MSNREWSKEFAYRLFDLMKYRGMSRRDLADALDINPATISDYLHCKYVPSATRVLQLAQVLHVKVSYLLDFERVGRIQK